MSPRQIPKLKFTDTRADEALHFVTSNFPKHPANLPVNPLAKDHSDADLADN